MSRIVFVDSLAYTGRGEVLRVRRDGRLLVESPTGKVHRVRPEDARDVEHGTRSSPVLERTPTYGPADLSAVPKEEPREWPEYLEWLRTQPCARCGKTAPSEPSHHPAEGHGSMGMKCPDVRAIPLCARCHRTGPLAHHRIPFARTWVEDQIAFYTITWAAQVGEVPR
jgi:hypothetical protein